MSSFTEKQAAIDYARANTPGNPIIEIDLTKFSGQFFHVSNPGVQDLIGLAFRARNNANISREFLIVTNEIPVSAYTEIIY